MKQQQHNQHNQHIKQQPQPWLQQQLQNHVRFVFSRSLAFSFLLLFSFPQEPFMVHKRGHQMKSQPKRIYAVNKAPDIYPLFRGNADRKDWTRIEAMP